jgi:N-acetylmuramoyl-L-alanine amidase
MRRSLATLLLALLLAGCVTEKGIIDKGAYELDTRHQAQAAYPRIKVLVIHYTADDFDSSLATLTDKNVSSHYLIPANPPAPDGKPRIWQLVPEANWPGMRASASGAAPTGLMIRLSALSWRTAAGKKRRALSNLRRLSLRKLRRWSARQRHYCPLQHQT